MPVQTVHWGFRGYMRERGLGQASKICSSGSVSRPIIQVKMKKALTAKHAVLR